MFTCYIRTTSQGCQVRDSDSKEWSMGGYSSAKFNVDNNGVSLQFSNGDDNRYTYYGYIGVILFLLYINQGKVLQ